MEELEFVHQGLPLGPASKQLLLLSQTVEGRCQSGPLPATLSSLRNQEIKAYV